MKYPAYVTIASDASVKEKHGMSAWACYIRTPRGVYRTAALFKEHITKSSLVAEAKAFANALQIADRMYDLQKARVIIYIDNNQVFNYPKKPNHNYKAKDEALNKIVPILARINAGYGYEYRHVKAHVKGDGSKKYFMNQWCDISCRRVIREALRQKEEMESDVV